MDDNGTQLQVFRELGSMDARIGNIEKDVASLNGKVDTLLERSAISKGSKGALLTVGGGSATVGGLIVAVGQWLGVGAHAAPTPPQPAPVVQTTPPAAPRAQADESVNPVRF